ncbi:MAG: response regulator transcription factor [Bacilli bacterium]
MNSIIHIIVNEISIKRRLKLFCSHFKFNYIFYSCINSISSVNNLDFIISYNISMDEVFLLKSKFNCLIVCIFLKHNKNTIISYYEKGMYDYIIVPFSYTELFLRINAIFCFFKTLFISNPNFHDIKISTTQNIIVIDKIKLNLTRKEYEIMYYLIKNGNNYSLRKNILKFIWNTNEETRVLDTTICNLRKKIKKFNYNVECKRGVGYRINKN